MFIRFRTSHRRIKIYVVENARRDGKVAQEIVAYLGSIEAELLSPAADREREAILARIAFWETANPKLKNLANRLGDEMQRLRMAVHARIPWPMEPERQRLELLEAQREAKLWHGLYSSSARMIETNERLAAKAAEQTKSFSARLYGKSTPPINGRQKPKRCARPLAHER
jgi:hypothetical protein